ncbi:MAG TPA: hypothetical protein VH164_00945, partial [Ktedonobacteraceae bacterium]|nr:hypothetical protein [Ktedonobacteraceae bacterium]
MQAKHLTSQRTLTHLLLGCMVVALFLGVAWLVPADKGYNLLLIALGYLCLLLVGMTLLIGPLNLLRQRRNPVNIYLRRDVGIWAGITGCLHVMLVLRGNIQDGEALLFFLRRETGGYTPLLTLYG